jgi:serine/threonine protein kinase/Tol biopolymer transport system component
MVLEREDWGRVDALLRAALDQPTGTRLVWLQEACSDTALRERVAQLVRLAEAEGDGLRPGGALDEAREVDLTQTAGPEENGEGTLLAPGRMLGRYEIRALLGAGGMGRVYRALDPRLGREVAIKALGQAFRADSASLRRFEREARLLATLSHPNIAAIYGFEMLEGAPYLILERIEGGALIERLRRGPVPFAEAVAIAVQVAEGLAEAHGKGVIHRDLKPSNVMLTADGRVKLVDFGLAKRTERDDGDVDVVNPTTAAGAILGTAPYMSPEQIHGEDVDTRTDVWAFGCLLYEMLVGRAPFQGRSVPEVLVTVLRDEPDWSALPPGVPPPVRQLLQRCLRKDPRARLQHIGDARLELVELGTAPELAPVDPARPRLASRALPWLVAVVSLGVAAAIAVSRADRTPSTTRAARLSLDLPSGINLVDDYPAPFAIAPEGSPFVLVAVENGTTRLYLRGLDDLALRALPGTEGARQPFFSPDARWVGFFSDRKLLKVPVDGGPVLPVSDVGTNPRGAAWAPDGTIVFTPSQRSGLARVPDGGGAPAPLTRLDAGRGEYSHRWPEILPGGRWVLFTAIAEETFSFDEARLAAVSLDTGERRTVLNGAGYGRYVGGGQLAFVRAGRVYSIAFDPERLETSGAPEVMLDGVRYDPQNGGTHLATTSGSRVLVYSPGVPSSPDRYLSWLHRDGRLTRLVETARMFSDPRLSPDGRQVAVVVSTPAGSDLWLVDANGTMTQLSFGLSPHRPTWTADGRHITVGAEQNGAWRLLSIPVDGKQASLLVQGKNRAYPNAWSADGRYLVFQEQRPQAGWDLLFLEVDAAGRPKGPPQPLATSPFHESNAALSADGRWVAYESDEIDGLVQAYVRSFPEGGRKLRASPAGARWPSWSRGRFYYWDTDRQTLHVARTREDAGNLILEDSRLPWDDGTRRPAALGRVVIRVTGARFNIHPTLDDQFLVLETSATGVAPPYARPVIVFDLPARPPG